MAQLLDKEGLDSELGLDVAGRRFQKVQCIDRWTNGCLNKECNAFRNERGDYFCVRNGLP